MLAGCVSQSSNAKPAAPSESAYTTHDFNYTSGNSTLSAILCEPNGTNAQTPGLVLTGGDGVTAEKLRSACETFAKMGFLALAHDNVENGTAEQDIAAVVMGAQILRGDVPGAGTGARGTELGLGTSPSRPVALWAHSAGTIFSAFAAYDPSVKPFTFIDTSGHMQIPICDQPGSRSPIGGDCLAYWSQFPTHILIVQGLNDTVVDPSFAQAFSDRLSGIGRYHRLMMVPNATHEFMLDKPGVLDAEVEFLKEGMNASGG